MMDSEWEGAGSEDEGSEDAETGSKDEARSKSEASSEDEARSVSEAGSNSEARSKSGAGSKDKDGPESEAMFDRVAGSETEDAGRRLAIFACSIFLRSSTLLSCVDLDGTTSSEASSLHSTKAVYNCMPVIMRRLGVEYVDLPQVPPDRLFHYSHELKVARVLIDLQIT
jgi:hypothetical protein